ncbi:MAG TPA: glycosyltransferase family 39 protein [Pirellulales bacterium]|nr:glycosyltransferase family 39 protein [Pirellulales bacterium]
MHKPRQAAVRLGVECLIMAALFVVYHFVLRWLMLNTGLVLGAVRPGYKVYRIVPLYIYWHPHIKLVLLLGLGVVACFLGWFRRVGWARNGSTVAVAAVFMAWQIAIACGVAMIDPPERPPAEPKTIAKRPWQKLWEPYKVHHASEYLTAVPRITTPRQFLNDYAGMMPELPLHCRHHPPGGPLFLWLVAQVFGSGVVPASLVTIAFASLSVPAVYLLARDALAESPARLATCLYVLAPNIVCYSATCMDAVFNVPMVWSIYLLWILRRSHPLLFGMAGGATTALAALMTFSASFLALWGVVVLALTALGDRERLANAAMGLVTAVATAALIYSGLYLWSGYDPFDVLHAAFGGQDEIMGGRGHSSLRQSLHFMAANLIAFLFCAGLPTAILWAKQVYRELRTSTSSRGRWLTLSFALTLLILDLAPLYTLETERIWLFMVPFLAIGAAARLTVERANESTSQELSPQAGAALVLLAGQTIVMELLLDWFW